jgi:uncharacterized protein YjbI with pentapeptide repeats
MGDRMDGNQETAQPIRLRVWSSSQHRLCWLLLFGIRVRPLPWRYIAHKFLPFLKLYNRNGWGNLAFYSIAGYHGKREYIMKFAGLLSRGYKSVATSVRSNLTPLLIITATLVGLIAVIVISNTRHRLGYDWHEGTGFEGKTLWDWMELLVIPVVLAVGAILFNRSERRNEIQIAEKSRKADREIASNRSQDEALQAYLDKMTELLLEKGLRSSDEESEVRAVARARMLTTLRSLDGTRKASLLRFLYESELIEFPDPVVNLTGADLSKAVLGGAYLFQANLSGVHLVDAFLSGATLTRAQMIDSNLNGAILVSAILAEANLWRASLCGAKLMSAMLFGVSLSGADLYRAELQGADLSNAILEEANMSRVDLKGAALGRANLSGANLSGANLGGANLYEADLSEANLDGADLSEADLHGADLRQAKVTAEQLLQAKSLRGATMPDGTVHD